MFTMTVQSSPREAGLSRTPEAIDKPTSLFICDEELFMLGQRRQRSSWYT